MSATRQCSATSPDGHRIAYDVTGEGRPLVLLTGFTLDKEWWHELGYIARLAQRRQVIAIDPLGHGKSDKPHTADSYRMERLSEHTVAVLDAEGLDAADVWGYSRGVLLTVAALQGAPERVRAAIGGGVDLAATGSSSWDSDALRRGDWDAFWQSTALGRSSSPEFRERTEAQNDPLAIAAVLDAPTEITVDPTKFRVLLYNGDGEEFAGSTKELADALGIECHVLPTGGHADTFLAADACCDVVEPFLDPS